MNKKWHINRRTFLKGLGATVALPTLDIMILNEKAYANTNTPHFFFDFVPNGYFAEEETNYIPRHMIPVVERLGDQGGYVASLSNPFRHKPLAYPHMENFLSFMRAQPFRHTDVMNNLPAPGNQNFTKTFDQYLVDANSGMANARIRTLSVILGYNTNRGFSFRTLSWRGPGKPIAHYYNPREVYNQLFSLKPNTVVVNSNNRNKNLKSVLDVVKESINNLNKKASAKDKIKLDQYYTGIREIERGLSSLDDATKEFNCELSSNLNKDFKEQNYQHQTFKQRLDIMQELLLIAHECEVTHCSNIMRAYPASTIQNSWVSGFKGPNKSWHGLSHYDTVKDANGKPYQGNGANISHNRHDFQLINKWHASNFVDFALKMKGRVDPVGKSLLDKTLLVHGSCQGKGPVHKPDGLFYLLAGNAGGRIKPNQKLEKKQTLANLWLTVMKRYGVDISKFGDATQVIPSI